MLTLCLATLHAKKELHYDHAVPYGKESSEILDIYSALSFLSHGETEAEDPDTILIYIHGGGWSAQDLKLVIHKSKGAWYCV